MDFSRYASENYDKSLLKQIIGSGVSKIEAILNNLGYFDAVISPSSRLVMAVIYQSFTTFLNEPLKVSNFNWQIEGEGSDNLQLKNFLKNGLLLREMFSIMVNTQNLNLMCCYCRIKDI